MSGYDIQQKVKNGLAKAVATTVGESVPVELNVVSVVSDPINGDTVTSNWVTLTNAVFKSYDKSLIDGQSILASDRELVSDSDNQIKQGDIIRSNGVEYSVHTVDDVSPSGLSLAFKSQCRAK